MLAPLVLALDLVVAPLPSPQNQKNPCGCHCGRYLRPRAGRDAGSTFTEDLVSMAAKRMELFY